MNNQYYICLKNDRTDSAIISPYGEVLLYESCFIKQSKMLDYWVYKNMAAKEVFGVVAKPVLNGNNKFAKALENANSHKELVRLLKS